MKFSNIGKIGNLKRCNVIKYKGSLVKILQDLNPTIVVERFWHYLRSANRAEGGRRATEKKIEYRRNLQFVTVVLIICG